MAPSLESTPYPSETEPKLSALKQAKSSMQIDSRPQLEQSITDHGLTALWNVGRNVTLPEPRTKHIPAVWRYKDTKAHLLKAGELVPAEEAERRALIMINPGPRKPPHTLDTILSAHQLLLPRERAICHRHTPFAVRFLIEGHNGFTAIAGKKMYMEPGDMIITPQWQWHDHGNDGEDNVIWLDGLNIPFFSLNPIDFLEEYKDTFGAITHESKVVTDEECAEMKFPWKVTRARLDATDSDHSIYEYRLPDGKQINSIIAAQAERILPNKATLPRQDTCNRIFQVHSGSGKTVVTAPRGGPTYELTWSHADCFVIPSWYKFTIHADQGEPAYLFTFSDLSLLENLGIYKANTEL
ncbi:RmlC-like cupin domain-containing protein [Hypoxylon sp. NC1633]|nr:RmlC-like cupin domain-containing protein [Hypoxylon sp. NC1633]